MRIVNVIADLPAPDLRMAYDFYVGYLGFEERMNRGWVVRYALPEPRSDIQVFVVTHDASAPINPAASIVVEDVQDAFAEAVDRGYEIVYPLTTEPWGPTRFFVRSPDGNVLNIVEHRG